MGKKKYRILVGFGTRCADNIGLYLNSHETWIRKLKTPLTFLWLIDSVVSYNTPEVVTSKEVNRHILRIASGTVEDVDWPEFSKYWVMFHTHFKKN